MTTDPEQAESTGALRQEAEEQHRERSGPPDRRREALHELEVHQIELELQNEELRRIQLELDASRRGYRDLFDFAPIGYLLLDRQGGIEGANLAAATLLGSARELLLRRQLGSFLEDRDRVALGEHLTRVFARAEREVCEVQLIRASETPIFLRLESSYLEGESEGPCRTALLDVSARRHAEEQLREADKRKDEFLALLGHELRNPLAPILSGAQILEQAQGDPATVERARLLIQTHVRHLARLVDDLLDVARIRSGQLGLHLERVELATVVLRAVEMVAPLLASRGHQLTQHLPPHPVYLRADPLRLAQALANLLRNAAVYTPEGGRVELTASLGPFELKLMVRDSGVGIAAERLLHVFEAFSQPDRARVAQRGLGLGLLLTRGLLERMDGRVELRSEGAGRGTLAVVSLPLPAQRERERDAPTASCAGPPLALVPRRRVLVVDDQEDLAESIAILLQLAGHEVRVAHSGEQALAEAARYRPEVVLLDIGLPLMDGYQVARRLREDPAQRETVLVALTGWGSVEDRRLAADAGFDHHLTKPAELADLQRILARR